MSSIDPDLLKEFLWTTREEIAQQETALVKMETGVYDQELINGIYRSFHSVKGAAGLLQLATLESATHICETLLTPIRVNGGQVETALVSLLLTCLDGVKASLGHLESGGAIPDETFGAFNEQYAAYKEGSTVAGNKPPKESTPKVTKEPTPTKAQANDTKANIKSEAAQAAPAEAASKNSSAPAQATPPATVSPNVQNGTSEAPSAAKEVVADTTVRVDIALLDRLMNLVGELVLARNQLLQVVSRYEDAQLTSTSQAIDQVTSDVQENIMRTRMQPIGNIFNKFPRIIRDLGQQLGKKIELEVSGKETELDRTLLEGLRDPFTHIIRNSCDHGVETPEERTKNGKSTTGTISIRAYHEGGQVIVEIIDDGRGIDVERIKAKAVNQGIISSADSQRMSNQEALLLICHPGFSTAEQVTNISGRGVGMDVVKKNIEKMGGQLEVISTFGKGSTIRLKIPLTLAIIPALMVRCGDQLFGIPQINLVELVGIENNVEVSKIERVRGAEVYRLRERLLTLVRLGGIIDPTHKVPTRDPESMDFIAVVADGNQEFGLVVDEILDTEEIVVKPLSRHLAGIEYFAGATIRGDGRVSLILDMAGVAKFAQVASIGARGHDAAAEVEAERQNNEFLVFRNNPNEQFAIPLQLVQRIEIYKEANCLSEVNGMRMICHNGKLTPAIELDRYTKAKPMPEDDGPIYAIVIPHISNAAIITKELVDNLAIDLNAVLDNQSISGESSVLGMTVVNDVPTSLLNVHAILDKAFPKLALKASSEAKGSLKNSAKMPSRNGASGHHAEGEDPIILFCEDTAFFQHAIGGFIKEIGFKVDSCLNGKIGYEKLVNNPGRYSMLVTDIEMPVMDGWELMKRTRELPGYEELPIIALTSLNNEESKLRAIQSGASKYLIKLQRDELIKAISEFIPVPALEV